MSKPKTIHDFGGFPKQLFDAQYPAPGTPEFAKLTAELVTYSHVQTDESWGLDHGTWSVLLPMYPAADNPVYQMSLDYDQPQLTIMRSAAAEQATRQGCTDHWQRKPRS